MASNSVNSILSEFDRILLELSQDPTAVTYWEKVADDLKLLNFLRSEINSEKQSLFIVGKTSTGKSEFHNFLLDTDDKVKYIFKASNKVETGILQTLQHCQNKDDAHAEIIVKDWEELGKVIEIPEVKPEKYLLPLNTVENIVLLRDTIMAKKENNSFHLQEAVHTINIHHPLKYFKNFIFIDTPGLGSNANSTDHIVRSHFQGKSYILWFLDASQRTLSGSLAVMANEKLLLDKNFNRIKFIANKFDIREDDERDLPALKNEMVKTFNKGLKEIYGADAPEEHLIFTSFKNPKKDLGGSNTCDELKKLENLLMVSSKAKKMTNIESLVLVLSELLNHLSEIIIKEKKILINGQIRNCEIAVKELQKDLKSHREADLEIFDLMDKSQVEINALFADVLKINNHKKHEEFLKKAQRVLRQLGSKFADFLNARLPQAFASELHNAMQEFLVMEDFSLKTKEGWLRRKFWFQGEELKNSKEKLNDYLSGKQNIINTVSKYVIDKLEFLQNDKETQLNRNRSEIEFLQLSEIEISKDMGIIGQLIHNCENITNLLIHDVQKSVEEWEPSEGGSPEMMLDNFLHLYALLDEHKFLNARKNN